ncbi:hypothetical protein N7468_009046 [Penicillium chermesinum]|uniref:Uncharacterized protein n=1 Tax=Penicillium chermesinum TaxID=63820 RepID=A0A9W9TEH2_9EURO|nr:uncharacterized protein N7468_009046 [Penicillium chermesinum]KAJ5219842.1 hypothetical protein N7468_009046 [Penicillium chermesinum]
MDKKLGGDGNLPSSILSGQQDSPFFIAMSAFNPFRARAADAATPDSRRLRRLGPQKKVSTSSDEQEVDPFDPDSAISDDDENEDYQLSRAPDNRPGNSSGSAPHLALSTDRASITSPSTNSLPREHNAPISPIFNAHDYQTVPQSVNRSDEQTSSEINSNTDPTGRSLKERKPPPPPKNHRGKRISNVSNAGALPEQPPPRPSDRLSNNPLAAENAASRPSGAPNASLVTQSTGEGFQGTPENQLATDSSESLSRSRSQSKRPPTPPQSRRQSQMRRSKSTQSKSSTSRLTISSVDSESNYGSQPPQPWSIDSIFGLFVTRPKAYQYASTLFSGFFIHNSAAASSPRRNRDSMLRSSDSIHLSPSTYTESTRPPQPSNAHDILADLTRLQKEVDDLRGHYEGRKVSQ